MSYFPIFLPVLLLDTLIYYLLLFLFKYACSKKTFLCQYHKWTDIYYLTWSFENVAKIYQFQFLELGGGAMKVFRPLPKTHTLTIFQGGYKKFLDPPKFIHLQTKHKKWIFSATIHLTRKRFIFPGRYLKADHFEKKLDMGGGPFKNAEGGV